MKRIKNISMLFVLLLFANVAQSQTQNHFSKFNFSIGTGVNYFGFMKNGQLSAIKKDGVTDIQVNKFKSSLPFSLKGEIQINRLIALGLSLNSRHYKMEYQGQFQNWDVDSTFLHQFQKADGNTNIKLRLNFVKQNLRTHIYGGFGIGWLLKDYYKARVQPNLTSWGRDSDGIPLSIDLTLGGRLFPFKKVQNLGFFTELGLAYT
jgi:hypothetical protein